MYFIYYPQKKQISFTRYQIVQKMVMNKSKLSFLQTCLEYFLPRTSIPPVTGMMLPVIKSDFHQLETK